MGRPGSAADDAKSGGFMKNYVLACIAAGMAETVTYPLDITRTRLQIQGEKLAQQQQQQQQQQQHKGTNHRGMFRTMFGIIKEEGLMKLYQGLPPALLRHVIYTGSRLQIYEFFRGHLMARTEGEMFPVWQAALCGVTAGAGGQFLASPTDLVKTQMQMEGRRVLEGHAKRYNGTLHAFRLIHRERGVRGLWRGWVPNCQRAALVNLGDFATYDSAKQLLIKKLSFRDDITTHTLASFASGFAQAVLGTPADVIKSRVMNEPDLYKGSVDCFMQTVRNEGLMSLYKGFFPCWLRLAPWATTFWLSYEQLRAMSSSSSF